MNITRHCIAFLVALFPLTVPAQIPYPSKPIRVLVGFPPGGPTDAVARLIGQRLTESWGQQVIIENRPGATGSIAAGVIAKAQPDGYTLLMGVFSHIIYPSMYKNLPYDVIRDFTPIILCASVANVLVAHPSLPVKSVKELIALARSRPGEVAYASSGVGSSGHLSGELLQMLGKAKLLHVPYNGSAPAHIAVVGGQVSLFFDSMVNGIPRIKSGRLTGLGVTTAKRFPGLPDVPAMSEFLPGFVVDSWFGVMGPAGLPRDMVTRLNVEIARILRQPDARERLFSYGGEPIDNTSEQFREYMRTELERWGQLIRTAGIRPE